MRRRELIAAAVSANAAVALTLLGGLTPARADASGCPSGQTAVTVPGSGTVCVSVSTSGGSGGSTGGNAETSDGSTCHNAAKEVIPCTLLGASWFSSQQCYAIPMSPQPPAGTSYWGARDPSQGQIWLCVQISGPSGAVGGTFFVAARRAPAIDPAVLAERAVKQMHLVAPRIGMAPESPAYTYVGLDTWLWIDPAQWTPLTMSAKAGPTSVRVTASPVRVSWDMGESSTSCGGPGRAWVKGMTDAATTDCSYTYAHTSDFEPGKHFPVSVLIVYRVDWRCSGACATREGSLGEVNSQVAHAAERVSERQTVVTGVS